MWSCSFRVSWNRDGESRQRRRPRKGVHQLALATHLTGAQVVAGCTLVVAAIALYQPPGRDQVAITSISSPAGGSAVRGFTRDESVIVKGAVKSAGVREVVLEVNGVRRPVTVQNRGFESRVPLIRGRNRIQALLDRKETGISGETETVKLVADIPPVLVWSELTWDGVADVDLHMTDALGEECWYGQHGPTKGGAFLDFDNTQQDGPEHITVSGEHPGSYRIWVNYFSARGRSIPVTWRVTLRLGTGAVRTSTGVLTQPGENQTVATFTLQ